MNGRAAASRGTAGRPMPRAATTEELRRLTAARDRALAEAELLNAINAAAAGEDDLERILAAGLDRLRRLIPFTGGSIAVVERDELVCVAASGPFAERVLGQRQPRSSDSRLWQVVRAIRSRSCRAICRPRGCSRAAPVISYLAVPLIWRGRTFGVLEVDSTERDAFTAADLALLRRVAAALSGPVQLARRLTSQEEQRRRLQDLLNVLPEGLAIAGVDGRFLLANAAAPTLLGVDLTLQAVPLAGDREFGMRRLDGTALAPDEAPLARALQRGETVLGEQLLVRNARGRPGAATADQRCAAARSRRPASTRVSSRFRTSPRCESWSGHAATCCRRSRTICAHRSPRSKGLPSCCVAAPSAHASADSDTAGVLGSIESSAEKMERMLAELMDIARLEGGRTWSWRDGRWTCSRSSGARSRRGDGVGNASDRARKRARELPGEWDEARLERVLGNLLSNAVKYSPEGGTVTVRVALRGFAGGTAGGGLGQRPGYGDPGRRPAAHLRALLPGAKRCRPGGRDGHRAGQRQADRAAAPGHARGGEHARPGQHVHCTAAAQSGLIAFTGSGGAGLGRAGHVRVQRRLQRLQLRQHLGGKQPHRALGRGRGHGAEAEVEDQLFGTGHALHVDAASPAPRPACPRPAGARCARPPARASCDCSSSPNFAYCS